MKKLFFALALAVSFISCSDKVENPSPGFQVYKDGVLLRLASFSATRSVSTGKVQVSGVSGYETVTLNIAGSSLGTYYFSSSNFTNQATYAANLDGTSYFYQTQSSSGAATVVAYPILNGGTGYSSGQGVATTGGSGTGLTVNIASVTDDSNNGVVKSVAVNNGGSGYYPGDVITVSGGNSNCRFVVSHVNGNDTNGLVTVTNNSDGTITGDFKFIATKVIGGAEAPSLATFQYGKFYKVPLTEVP
jgi:hypothetical protein